MLAMSILALTVSTALVRPRIGSFHVHHGYAAIFGAILMIGLGILPVQSFMVALKLLIHPIVTIASLMTVTIVADRSGLLRVLAASMARVGGGSGPRLFGVVFVYGALVGAVFTNDAAILLLTPLVFSLVEEVQEPGWSLRNKLPFYFAILYVGNIVGLLVVSNPINIVVCSIFGVGFLDYARWMFLPASVSMAVSFVGLRVAFRHHLPLTYRMPERRPVEFRDPVLARLCAAVVALTLLGFFSSGWSGIPTWAVALAGALILLAATALRGGSPHDVLIGVGWDVIAFLVGIFLIAMGLRNVGVTHVLASVITGCAGDGAEWLRMSTGLVAAVCSSVINNHPTAGLMVWVIQDLAPSLQETKMLVFSALIGGDLGPKMLPIGSLAALMWFGLLRKRGVDVPYSLYIRIGVPVTLLGAVLAILTLNLQQTVVTGLAR